MTAEILIMNREAAVLAADSAVTLDQRTFNTDKIFRLTENQPIGLMIYNSPNLLGVPIAQIAKTFRRKHSDMDFQSIDECIKAFLKFIKTEVIKKSDIVAFEMEARGFLNEILAMILSQHETVKQFGFLSSAEQTFIECANVRDTFFDEFTDLVNEYLESHKDYEVDASCSNTAFLDLVNGALDSFIADVKEQLKKEIPLECITVFREFIEFFVNRKLSSNRHTGMIFCGYGASDTFPSYKEIIIDGLSKTGTRHWEMNNKKISYDNNAVIMPFAQTKAIDPILLGMNDYILTNALNFIKEFNHSIIEKHGNIFDQNEAIHDYDLFLRNLGHNVFSSFLGSIRHMPKEELAIVAEALIDLCSMTRKMENRVRSVGGPTDVAIISKADGFIWKKRKHYFDKKLNLHFS